MKPHLILLAAVGALALVSCQRGLEETRNAVATTAAAVDAEFTAVRVAEEHLVTALSTLYETKATLDLSTQGMDVAEGGLYQSFPGDKYYYKSQVRPTALYVSTGRPATAEVKAQVKFFEFLEPSLVAATHASDLLTVSFYGVQRPTTVALMAPWADVVSTLPPGIDVTMFEWYTRGLHSAGRPVWSSAPFTDLTTGWVMDVSAPVKASGEDEGVAVLSVNLEKLSRKYLAAQTLPLLLAGHDGTVVGITPSAQALLGIQALEAVDYLRQKRENTFAPGKYKWGDPSQTAEVQALGRLVAEGRPEFELNLGGKAYTVVQKAVPETQMVVVGFAAH